MHERARQFRQTRRREAAIEKIDTVEAAQSWVNKQGKPPSQDRPYTEFKLDEQLPQPVPDRRVF